MWNLLHYLNPWNLAEKLFSSKPPPLEEIPDTDESFEWVRSTEKSSKKVTYARVNRFKEILSLLGNKDHQVPAWVVSVIENEIVKQNIPIPVTSQTIKRILREKNRCNYYDYAEIIASRINGDMKMIISPELESKIMKMFSEIWDGYEKVNKSPSTNFLLYNFLLVRILQILGEHEKAARFIPKDLSRWQRNDEIWKSICKENGYEYIPLVNEQPGLSP